MVGKHSLLCDRPSDVETETNKLTQKEKSGEVREKYLLEEPENILTKENQHIFEKLVLSSMGMNSGVCVCAYIYK